MKKYFWAFLAIIIGTLPGCQKMERDNALDRHDQDYIEFESFSVNSESIKDNIITPGENLRIGINYISNTTWGASITISTTSPYAECESGAAHLSSNDVIMHHQPSFPSSASGFLVHILEDAPMGATININVHISSNSGSLSEGSFTLTVGESW